MMMSAGDWPVGWYSIVPLGGEFGVVDVRGMAPGVSGVLSAVADRRFMVIDARGISPELVVLCWPLRT